MKKVSIPEFLRRLAKFKKQKWVTEGFKDRMLRMGHSCPINVVFYPLRWSEPETLPLTKVDRAKILNAADGWQMAKDAPYSEKLRRQLFKAVGLRFVPGQPEVMAIQPESL